MRTGGSANRFTLMTCLVAMTANEYDALYGRRELRRRLTFQLLLDCLSVCNYCETYCLVMTVHLVGITVVSALACSFTSCQTSCEENICKDGVLNLR